MAGSQQRESDRYNGSLQTSSTPSSKSAYPHGYGLGFSSGVSPSGGLGGPESRGLSFSPGRSSMSDEILSSQESSSSTAYLEPFGGADKFYPPPSPLKPKAPSEASLPYKRHAVVPLLQNSCLYVPPLPSNQLGT